MVAGGASFQKEIHQKLGDEINQVKNDADVDNENIAGHREEENDSSGSIEEAYFLIVGIEM